MWGLPLAWVGFAQEDAAQSVRPWPMPAMAQAICTTSSSAGPQTRRPGAARWAGLAQQRGRDVEDLTHDPGFQPWLDAAVRHGYHSLVVLPLHDAQRSYGIFALFAPKVAHIGADEMRLLQN